MVADGSAPEPLNGLPFKAVRSFLGDEKGYGDYLKSAASFNTRLLVERRMRLPFLDASTGIAQNSSSLFFNRRDRMPGDGNLGKIYCYPSARWKKRRRQYYLNVFNAPERVVVPEPVEVPIELDASISQISQMSQPSNSGTIDQAEESRDALPPPPPPPPVEPAKPAVSQPSQEASAWAYYDDDLGLDDDDFEQSKADSDDDYEETFKKKKKKGRGKEPTPKQAAARGRKRGYEKDEANDKPFGCEVCGTRYKTRPGLVYHYTHSHKDHPQYHPNSGGSRSTSNQASPARAMSETTNPEFDDANSSQQAMDTEDSQSMPASTGDTSQASEGGDALAGLRQFQDSFLSFLKTPEPGASSSSTAKPGSDAAQGAAEASSSADEKPSKDGDSAKPSPYCDFCLGDTDGNRKTGRAEKLVSCSDCGRSGHPSCLQFSANMIISVKKYRWQCIECKCCTLCGTSENDDQLLFCDDCDRGYHMYCLKPALTTPPDGNWSCSLCMKEFHS